MFNMSRFSRYNAMRRAHREDGLPSELPPMFNLISPRRSPNAQRGCACQAESRYPTVSQAIDSTIVSQNASIMPRRYKDGGGACKLPRKTSVTEAAKVYNLKYFTCVIHSLFPRPIGQIRVQQKAKSITSVPIPSSTTNLARPSPLLESTPVISPPSDATLAPQRYHLCTSQLLPFLGGECTASCN